ncbi:MAG: hypothetical protein KDC88_06545 [Ignavibacteriae bacterium]|nr:hypothetical protein [Ignavibacteriota bacterium]MCB9206476.1 hypothetical protein [Ignavibacteriales bacterium]MCB9219395.1 hypothetical protein [Ignavibacteriales bacterium]MCB9259927.1 hypothetical protein [Ignavibacteriales bacterium]
MEFNYQDKGNYFRGLLILVGKDNIIEQNERKTILSYCEKLGFEKRFCEDAVSNFLENSFIDKNPPKFSSIDLAKKFLEDAIKLSLVDNDFHVEELEWLENVAKVNLVEKDWLDKKIQQNLNSEIEVNHIIALKNNIG